MLYKTLINYKYFCVFLKLSVFQIEKFLIKREKKFKINDSDRNEENIIFNQTDIKYFLRKFLLKYQKLEFEKMLEDKMSQMCINSLNDLTTLPPHSWETLSSYISPVILSPLQKEVNQIRTNLKSSAYKSREMTLGEIYADIHKIRRFLLYETRIKNETDNRDLIDDYSYLSMKALELGFKEQKKDQKFDGGPVLDHIKHELEKSFATPNLPNIIKPSHGMILVIEYTTC